MPVNVMSERFLSIPHLPSRPVSCVIMSDGKPPLTAALQSCHIQVIPSEPLPFVSGSERFHADMSVCHAGREQLFIAHELSPSMKALLSDEGFTLTETRQSVTAERPSLNICVLHQKVLCHTPTADPSLLSFLQSTGKQILYTRQRYSKCSAAVVYDNALITSDPSIEKISRQNGIDVLKIRSGFIELDGYTYGFIGGCCGLLSRDILAFSGCIEQHPDYQAIKAFARNYGVSLLSLSGEKLYDIGGILPLKEYTET